jgi:CubicO group peptidase (beta-lactamase class C family)
MMVYMVDTDELRAHATGELQSWQVPGLELVVLQNGEVLIAEGLGLRNVEQNLPATPTTLFHHGSTGKAFTGVLAGTLVDAGLLEWDRPIREYLPDFRLHNSAIGERITVIDLLSHRSGLARHEWVWLANPSLSRAELVHRLRYLESNLDLRTTFEYSNLAYVTVGHLIASVTGSTWEEEMRRRVLEPLGMDRTVTSVDMAQTREHAEPYGSGEPRRPIPWRRSDQIAPAGQMISCAEDIARWLALQLSDGEVCGHERGSTPRRMISAAALAETKRLRTPLDVPGPDPDMHFYGYACGWIIGTYRGRRLVWHNGGIDGFKTDIALMPDDGIAVAVSCNVLQTELPFAVAFHTLDVLLGEKPRPWSENLRATDEESEKPAERVEAPETQPSHPLDEYSGDYEHPGYGTLHVEMHDRDLRVRLGELDMEAHYRHYDTWKLHYDPLDSSWPLTFLTDAEGHVSTAEIPLEPSIGPIRFEATAKERKV